MLRIIGSLHKSSVGIEYCVYSVSTYKIKTNKVDIKLTFSKSSIYFKTQQTFSNFKYFFIITKLHIMSYDSLLNPNQVLH